MDFDYSSEQTLLKESLERFLRERYTLEARRRAFGSALGFEPEIWRRFAEFGWLGIGLSEASGGLGGGAVETMILMEAFGRALVVEPFLATVILGARLVDRCGSPAQRDAVLPAVVAGERKLALAHAEPQARFALDDVRTTAQRSGADWVLSGAKTMVLHAQAADTLIIVARSAGAQHDRAGLSLFLVPRDWPGVSLRDCQTVDGLRAADLVLDGVRVGSEALLGEPEGAYPALAAVIDFATVAVAAEAVGVLEEANRITLEYLKTREQFGRKIGSFQALQHRMVEMFMEAELARSLVMAAAIELDEDAPRREATVAAAKLRVGRAAKLVGPNAIQLHGGMGMSAEYAIGHYFKRLTAIEIWFGNSAFQRRRYLASAG